MRARPSGFLLALAAAIVVAATPSAAQRAPIGDAVREFVAVDAPVVALTNARVIDGTGAPVRPGQTIVVVNGAIEAIGPSATTTVPAGARILDLAGKSVMPGLVMVHEHFYYPTGPGVYGQLGQSFVRLYLAGGVTTIRTAGNLNGYMDITLKRRVDAGEVAGPAIDATMPYVNGPSQFVQMTACSPRSAPAGTSATGPTRAPPRSRPTCRSPGRRSAPPSARRTPAG